jgi:hypothetical protein
MPAILQHPCQVKSQISRNEMTGVLYLTGVKCLHSTSKKNTKEAAIKDFLTANKAQNNFPDLFCTFHMNDFLDCLHFT